MRLIDANALKEDLVIKFGNQLPNGLLEEIDNAPTVKTYCYYCGQKENGTEVNDITDFYPKIFKEQGKWLHDDLDLDVRCSICGSYALERGDYPMFSKYCPACGALMEVNNND